MERDKIFLVGRDRGELIPMEATDYTSEDELPATPICWRVTRSTRTPLAAGCWWPGRWECPVTKVSQIDGAWIISFWTKTASLPLSSASGPPTPVPGGRWCLRCWTTRPTVPGTGPSTGCARPVTRDCL